MRKQTLGEYDMYSPDQKLRWYEKAAVIVAVLCCIIVLVEIIY